MKAIFSVKIPFKRLRSKKCIQYCAGNRPENNSCQVCPLLLVSGKPRTPIHRGMRAGALAADFSGFRLSPLPRYCGVFDSIIRKYQLAGTKNGA